ncbi:probable protein phosphatase 2C 70 [Selaginella moellendorffii]|uniref:probable protein phosphatase 2C 70 n=1 Tax=Selaginella moellendorffii TaxID=88036 RepID=UPI000D1CF826|nr:probable protein phosphatase 2C 70 [Selaginella moellendorffii]|eukprot:XP_024527454.1 probable protein phosphatase 2C 70 [Selaginella moellendorffii]
MAATVIMLGYGDMDTSEFQEPASKVVRAHTEGCSTDGSLDKLRWGACSIQGWPDYMEDSFAVCVDNKDLILGVYDGHRGSKVSSFCAQRLHIELLQTRADTGKDFSTCLAETFMRMDELLLNKSKQDEDLKHQGSTSLVVVINEGKLVVANTGDCRCVLYRQGKAVELSRDHCGNVGCEKSRVEGAGGYVKEGRVYSSSLDSMGLGVSRAIGDLDYKMNTQLPTEMQVVIASPEITEVDIEDDEFIVLASDGIWGSRSSDDVVKFVAKQLKDGAVSLSGICRDLAESCLTSDGKHSSSRDNMTVIIVRLSYFQSRPELMPESGRQNQSAGTDPRENEDEIHESTRKKQKCG